MENIFTVFRPFYLLLKTFGAFPISFVGPVGNGVLRTKWHDFLLPILSLSLFFLLLVVKVSTESFVKSNSTILAIAWNYLIVFDLLTLLIQLCFQISRRAVIKQFLKLLNEFDRELTKLGLRVDHKRHQKVVVVVTFLVIGVNVFSGVLLPIYYYYTDFIVKFDLFVGLSYGYKNIFKLFYTVQLFFANFAVEERLKLLNDFLRWTSELLCKFYIYYNYFYYRKSHQIKTPKAFSISKNSQTFKLVSKLYLDLYDEIDNINSCFTFHTIFLVIGSIVSFQSFFFF